MSDPLLPPLFKRTASGGTQLWQIEVLPQSDGTAVIKTTFGLVDGKQQVQEDHIKEGKNLGARNATTPLEQALKEAAAEHKKKLDRRGYGTDAGAEESAAKRAASPMLAYSFEDYVDRVDWSSAFGQPKLDGFRCLARRVNGQIEMVSREGKAITTLDHIAAQLDEYLDGEDVTLDGELWTPELTFQQIAGAVKKQQDSSAKIQYHVYDCVRDEPFGKRTEAVHALLSLVGAGAIVPVETVRIRDASALLALQSRCVADGFEGAMLRYSGEGYEAGKRSRNLLKVKSFQSAEFEIVGVVEGRGTHAGMAVLQCRTADGAPFDVTAPGTHAEKKAAWLAREQLIGQRVETKFFELTTSDQPVPRFPVALRVHEFAVDVAATELSHQGYCPNP